MDDYQKSLSSLEKKTHEIAKDHLKTSYSMEKSIGFKEFIAKKTSS